MNDDLCGCVGPQYGEPYCPCEMEKRGIPLNQAARDEENDRIGRHFEEAQ